MDNRRMKVAISTLYMKILTTQQAWVPIVETIQQATVQVVQQPD